MSRLPVSGEQPVVPLPEREPAAIRAAVARLDPPALARFEADWTAATARARDEYSLLPARYLVERWFSWVAVARWPELAARLSLASRIADAVAVRRIGTPFDVTEAVSNVKSYGEGPRDDLVPRGLPGRCRPCGAGPALRVA